MNIAYSRRILCVSAPGSRVLDVIKDLTGSAPAPDVTGSTAGLTHEWDVKTAYFTAKVPIWVDEIPDIEAWKTEFLKPEAREVIEAVGAWVYCFNKPHDGSVGKEAVDVMKAIEDIVQEHAGYGADAVLLAVAMPDSKQADNAGSSTESTDGEDVCMQYGFEHIDYSAQGTNEFSEKVGFERLKEALETTDWAAADADDELDIDDLDFGVDEDVSGFGMEEAEMTAELFGMKAALSQEDDGAEPEPVGFVSATEQATQVDDLDRMMSKLLAVKEQSAGLPEAQRKRMAAQAVKDLMGPETGGQDIKVTSSEAD